MLRTIRLLAFAGSVAVAGCNETGPLGQTGLVKVSADASPVALVSVDGPPAELTSRLAGALSGQAAVRDINIVTAEAKPRYTLKGYVTAYATQGGTQISWVWDMFDDASRRAQRLSGSEFVTRSAVDPWSAVDDATLARIAGQSMDGVALFLTGGADAVAARTGRVPATALGYAAQQ